MKKVIILGAGPAGLTSAYHLLKKNNNYKVIIVEEEKAVGEISKTVKYNNTRMDLGVIAFFRKIKKHL